MLIHRSLAGKKLDDPRNVMLQLAVAAAAAPTLHDFWQKVASTLSALSGGGPVTLDFVDRRAVGSVKAGLEKDDSALPISTGWHEKANPQVRVTIIPRRISLPVETVKAVLAVSVPLSELVARRTTFEFEKRESNFLVELFRWMAETSTDPTELVRNALRNVMFLTNADTALIVVRGSEPDTLRVMDAVGDFEDQAWETLLLVEKAVEAVFATPRLLQLPNLDTVISGASKDVLGRFGSAMLAPLQADGEVRGALCVLQCARQRGKPTPFSVSASDQLEQSAEDISKGVELLDAIEASSEAAEQASEHLFDSEVPQAVISSAASIVHVNDAFSQLFRFGAADVSAGRKVTALPIVIKDGKLTEVLAQIRTGLPWQGRVHLIRGGDLRRCVGVATQLPGNGQRKTLLAIHDRTEEFLNRGATTPDPGPTVGRMLKEVSRTAHLAHSMVNPPKSTDPCQPIDVRDLVREALEVRARVLPPSAIPIRFGNAPEPAPVTALPTNMHLVLAHLITNAEDAVTPREDARISVDAVRNDGRVRVLVSDSGPGVDPDVRTRIFDPYYTTKDRLESPGLGLALARRIVWDLHGDLWVEDADLGGSAFVIELPLAGA